MKSLPRMLAVGVALVGVLLLCVAGFASTVVVEGKRQSDSGITSVIQASLLANDDVKVEQVEVETREGVVYLTGLVDTEDARREAGRVAWSTEGVRGVMNDLRTGGL
jgi:osmotically-inducible protein OsmY